MRREFWIVDFAVASVTDSADASHMLSLCFSMRDGRFYRCNGTLQVHDCRVNVATDSVEIREVIVLGVQESSDVYRSRELRTHLDEDFVILVGFVIHRLLLPFPSVPTAVHAHAMPLVLSGVQKEEIVQTCPPLSISR